MTQRHYRESPFGSIHIDQEFIRSTRVVRTVHKGEASEEKFSMMKLETRKVYLRRKELFETDDKVVNIITRPSVSLGNGF